MIAGVFVAAEAGVVGGKGDVVEAPAEACAEEQGVVLAIDGVVRHPAIEAKHALQAEGDAAVVEAEEVAAGGGVEPVGGGVGVARIGQAVAAGGLEVGADHEVDPLVAADDLVEGSEDEVADAVLRRAGLGGVSASAGGVRHLVGLGHDAAHLHACAPIGDGDEEAGEEVGGAIAGGFVVFAAELQLPAPADAPVGEFGVGEGVGAEVAWGVVKELHALTPVHPGLVARLCRGPATHRDGHQPDDCPDSDQSSIHFQIRKNGRKERLKREKCGGVRWEGRMIIRPYNRTEGNPGRNGEMIRRNLYKARVRYCTRCVYATVQGACIIKCTYPVAGANDYSPLQTCASALTRLHTGR